MILTVTPNPSLDRTYELTSLQRGAVQRAAGGRIDAGGKGVNVARALVVNGITAIAVVPLGGPDGQLLAALLAEDAIPTRGVRVSADTRSNITLVEADGTVTKLNAPGNPLAADDLEALLAATDDQLAAGVDWLVACGSLPEGAPIDLYARLVSAGRAAGALVAVDTSGPALAAAVDARPDLLKPNRSELEELVGRTLDSRDAVVAAAEELRERGVATVLVSLGADGAVLAEASGTYVADAPRVSANSDVGAGDALLAGFLSAGARGPGALAAAVAWGTCAVQLPGTAVPQPDAIAALVPLISTRQVDQASTGLRPAQPAS